MEARNGQLPSMKRSHAIAACAETIVLGGEVDDRCEINGLASMKFSHTGKCIRPEIVD